MQPKTGFLSLCADDVLGVVLRKRTKLAPGGSSISVYVEAMVAWWRRSKHSGGIFADKKDMLILEFTFHLHLCLSR